MNVNVLSLSNGHKVLLLEDIFPEELKERMREFVDEKKNMEKVIQKLTDDFIAKVEQLFQQKEKDLLED